MMPDLLLEIFPTHPHCLLIHNFENCGYSQDFAEGGAAHAAESDGTAKERSGLSRVLPRCYRKEMELGVLAGYQSKCQVIEMECLTGRERRKKVGSPKMKVFPTMYMKTNSNKFQHFEFATMCMKLNDL